MKIHNSKQEAKDAIYQYADIVRAATKATGAEFVADASDDTGLEYYIEAEYRGEDKKVHRLKIHFQTLDL